VRRRFVSSGNSAVAVALSDRENNSWLLIRFVFGPGGTNPVSMEFELELDAE